MAKLNFRSLKSITLRDFRSIEGEWTVPLDANVVLIHGHNGAGKTSLLSALELAATGTVSFLDRLGDESYRQHLHNRSSESAAVSLEAVTDEGATQQGWFNAGTGGVKGQPLLDASLAEVFTERCFLSQALLGRLFETYSTSNNKQNSPLVRFVKEVLGLDALDALVDGLYASGHTSRVRDLVPAWRNIRAEVSRLEVLKASQSDKLGELQRSYDLVVQKLHSASTAPLLQASDTGAVLTGDGFSVADLKERERSLGSVLLRLSVIEDTLSNAGQLQGLTDADDFEPSGAERLAERHLRWRAGMQSFFLKSAELLPVFEWRDETTSARVLLDACIHEKSRVESLTTAVNRELEGRRIAEQTALSAQRDIAELRGRLERLGPDREPVSDTEELADLLMLARSRVVDDECPVCRQQFSSNEALDAFLSRRIDSIAVASRETAEALREKIDIERRIEETGLRARRATEQLAEFQTAVVLEATASALRTRVPVLSQALSLASEGVEIEREINLFSQLEDEREQAVTMAERCASELRELAEPFGWTLVKGVPAQQIADLRSRCRGIQEDVDAALRRAETIKVLRTEADALQESISEQQVVAAATNRSLRDARARFGEAEKAKTMALALRKAVEEKRASSASEVFNGRLNQTWATLFSALVPSEPFVPQFKPFQPGGRTVSLEVETRDPDGVGAPAPAAMLSQGNLNTAALSLFVALHFAGSGRLPWLLFDDPVQSMDDLHVANFAALVKQLARRNGTQVVIAVHQRELYEYLSLELAPAGRDEELIAIELSRTYGRSLVESQRIRYKQETAQIDV